MKVQAESFHLNGHIIGFHPLTQKLESSHKTPSSTLAVKGLTEGKVRRKFFQTKLLSLLSHRVCRLLSSPVLLHKFNIVSMETAAWIFSGTTNDMLNSFIVLFFVQCRRYMFGLSGVPALIQGVGMFFLPHSPRWLIVNGQDEKVLIIFL